MSIAATTTFSPQQSAGVLVASPNGFFRKQIVDTLHSKCWPVEEACGGAEALGKLESTECELLILDQRLPDLDTGELRAMIKAQYPGVDVLMWDPDTGRAVAPPELRTTGAMHLLNALDGGCQGSAQVMEIVRPLPPAVHLDPLPGMIGGSESMSRLYRIVRLVAPRDTAVLLTGDSGSGKELVAQAVHKLSPRAMKPFVIINCAAIPETLLESELFGYTRGSFTGAVQSRAGRIHAAQSGTLFLDEIGEIPLSLQSKLLRFLESGEVQRLGSVDVFKMDVRVVAATNANLEEKVRRGEFRKDLYYRLSVFPVELPPLSERKEDIYSLAEHFLNALGSNAELSIDALECLQRHDWPGNVRELKHVIERATILAEASPVILPEHIVISAADFIRRQA